MSDIDLIPADYRDWLFRKALLTKCAVALVATNVVVLVAGISLAYAAATQEERAAELQLRNAVTQQQYDQLMLLKEQQAEFERRWSLLRSLRAGAAVDDIFLLIDRSVVAGDLWFLDWGFRRAGVIVDGQQRGIETGYFIIVTDEPGSNGAQDLSVETHMTIHGQARDHQALSKFVRTLFEQPDIKDVNVKRTTQTQYANGRVVDFNLTVVLNSAFKAL